MILLTQQVVQEVPSVLDSLDSIFTALNVLLTFILGLLLYGQNAKLTIVKAQLNHLYQNRYNFDEEKRTTVLRYYDIIANVLHVVSLINNENANESMKKLNVYDETLIPLIKRVVMLTKNEELGKVHSDIHNSITNIIVAMDKILKDAIVQNINLPNDSVYEESRVLKYEMYAKNIVPLEEKLSNLIYAELEKLANQDQI